MLVFLAQTASSGGGGEISRATLALISGGSAVLGALAGGGVAGWGNLRAQTSRQRFDRGEREAVEQREDVLRARQVRGIAREMRTVFKENLDVYNRHVRLGFWWNDDLPNPGRFERESDRVLVAAAASADQWNAIEQAEREGRAVEAVRTLSIVNGTRALSERDAVPGEESALSFEWNGHPDEPEKAVEICRRQLTLAVRLAEAATAALDELCVSGLDVERVERHTGR